MACVFCAIAEGKIPCATVFESEKSLVIMDIFPEAPGHCLVLPKTHFLKPGDLPAHEFHELVDLVVRVQDAIVASGLGQGTNLVQNYWPFVPEGGLKVDHVHFHLVPRNPGDELKRPSSPVGKEELEKNAAKIRRALR